MYLFHNTIITFTISFVLVAFLVCVWRALDFLLLKPRKIEKQLRAQGLVGNPYRPVFGDLKQYIKMKNEANSRPMINLSDDILPRVSPFFLKTVKKYGTSSFVWFGPLPLVIIKDPKLMKEILQNHNLFHKALSPDSLDLMLAQGLFTAEGDRWAKHRKLINPAFHLEKIKLMLPAFRLCTMQMLAQWERSHSIGESCNIDVWPFLETLTSDAISRTAFGSNYEEGKQIFELQREQANHIMAVFQSLNFPGMRFLPTRRNRRMKEIEQLVDLKVRNIIEKRIKGRKLGEGNKDDLLSILVESNAREIAQHEGNQDFGLSIEDVIQECKLFYFAGQETLTTLLTWTLILLSKHQDWQTRARDEVLQVFGKEEIDFHGLSQLKVLTMIFNEVLRLYTPGPVMMRRTHKEVKLGEFKFPAGVYFALHVLMSHRDSEMWGDDANEFKPERFREGISNATTNDQGQAAFLPFSWGPRICIGQNYAMVQAKLAMAMILQRFAFQLSPSYTHAPHIVMVILKPQHGANIILQRL